MTTKLYYWPARGRGEQIRIILADAGIPFEDITWDMAKGETEKLAFFERCKHLAGNLTTNIPMIEDKNGKFYTQSTAIIRKLGRENNLYNDTYEEDMLLAAAEDLRSSNYKAMRMFGASDQVVTTYVNEVLPKHLKNLQRILLKSPGLFLLGNKACIADLTMYDALHVSERQVPGILSRFPRVKLFFDTVECRPGVKEWIESEQRAKLMAFPSVVNDSANEVEKPERRCPWPFILFHDPKTGMKDWETWALFGAVSGAIATRSILKK